MSIPTEFVSLTPVESDAHPGIGIICMGAVDSMDGFYEWSEGAEILIEGTRANYAIQPSGGFYSVNIVLTPLGGPTVQLTFWTSKEGVTALQNAEPGTIVVNGVDIAEVLQEDDLVSQLL